VGHPRAAGEAVRGRERLPVHVEVSAFGPLEGLNPPHTGRIEAEQLGRPVSRSLLIPIDGALPGDEHPADPQKGRRILDQDRQRVDGPDGHRVVGLAALACTHLLGACRQRAGVGRTGRQPQPLDDLALAARGLDQVDPSGRQRDGQHQAREARARADVRDRTRPTQLLDREPGQAVGDVCVRRRRRISDGRRGVRLRGEAEEQSLEPLGRAGGQPVALRQGGQRFA